MPIEVVRWNGRHLGATLRSHTIPVFKVFKDTIVPDSLASFHNVLERAEEVVAVKFEALGKLASADFDQETAAEIAYEKGSAYFEVMTYFKSGVTNLLSVGLFHLFEQKLGQMTADALFDDLPKLSDYKLSKISSWYMHHLDIDLAQLPKWSELDTDLRLIANTVKHAEGNSANRLRALHPQMFDSQRFPSAKVVRPVYCPLFGDEFRLSSDELLSYCNATIQIFESLAAYLESLSE